MALAAAWALVGSGSGLAWGVGVGLVAAGVALGGYFLVVYDAEDPEPEPPEPAESRWPHIGDSLP